MKNTGKVGNKDGAPKFRTPSTFIANQSAGGRTNNNKFDKFSGGKKGFNANGGRSMKVFNRGKV
jgi:hypothetical protein